MKKKETPESIAREIFYKPATNGQAEISIKEGAELIKKFLESQHQEQLKEIKSKIFNRLIKDQEVPYTSIFDVLEIIDKHIK